MIHPKKVCTVSEKLSRLGMDMLTSGSAIDPAMAVEDDAEMHAMLDSGGVSQAHVGGGQILYCWSCVGFGHEDGGRPYRLNQSVAIVVEPGPSGRIVLSLRLIG